MGYRSDVAYLIIGEKADIINFITKVRVSGEIEANALNEITLGEFGDAGFSIAFRAESLKWYDYFDDVRSHNSLFAKAMDEESLSGRFIRIGESDDDLEDKSFGDADLWDDISLARSIEFSAPLGERNDIRKNGKLEEFAKEMEAQND